jgi:hypothetical protein
MENTPINSSLNSNSQLNIHEPANEGTGSGGIDIDAPLSFSFDAPDDAFLDPCDWIDDLPTAYAKSLPPLNVTRPCLWRPRQNK